MNKKICLLFSLIILFTVMCVTQLEADWTYQRAITLTPGTTVDNYQVLVELDDDSPISFDYSHAKSNGEDIRFSTDGSGSSEPDIDYWIEEWNDATDHKSRVWIEVPSSGATTIYMYYGNTAASAASEGDATFIFFDDFNDGSLGAEWTFSQIGEAIGSCLESGTVIRLTGTNTGDLFTTADKFLFLSISGNYDNVIAESYTSAWGGDHNGWSKMGGVQLRQSVYAGSKNRIMSPVYSGVGATSSYRQATDAVTDEETTSTEPEYNRVSRVGATSRAWYSTDGISWTELGSPISFTGGLSNPVLLGVHLAGCITNAHWVEVDWFRVRKYADPEPTASVGSETPGGDYSLPVELSVFTAQYLNNMPTLYWQTQSETSNAGWNIYRGETNEALSNEETYQLNLSLGLIPGAGTTSEPTEYSFEDFFPVYAGNTYFYWLESVDYSGESEIYGPISLTIPENEWQNPNSPEIPKPYGLHQNYPNPFNPNTEISFMMKESCIGELSIFNIKGQNIKTIFSDLSIPRDELIIYNWNGKDESGKEVSTGVYYYKLMTTKGNYIRKMILMK